MNMPARIENLLVQTVRLQLCPLKPENAPLVLTYHQNNRDFLKPWNPRLGKDFYTLPEQTERLSREQIEMQAGRLLRLWIFAKSDAQKQTVLGHIALSNIVWGAFRSCFLGYSMAQNQNGKGFMTEALAAVVQLAFGHLKLHRLEANIMPRNTGSIRVVEKLGFVCEGTSPKYLKINGAWEDHLHYVIRNTALEN
jgi:[ribosomal protein S5]-alanine N-acetyltransferase